MQTDENNCELQIVEQDTIEQEEISDIFSFVTPSFDVIRTSASFGVQFRRNIFEGWVKQPSACCGASSVAGAWNALFGLNRNHPNALNHAIVLEVYRRIMREREIKKVASFERKLGSTLDLEFWNDFSTIASQMGKSISGKKDGQITKRVCSSIVRTMILDKMTTCSKTNEIDAQDEVFIPEKAWKALSRLVGDDELNGDIQPSLLEMGKEDVEMDDSDDSCEEGAQRKGNAKNVWNWVKDLHEIVKVQSGIKKLGGEKPTTAPIGNWGIILAVSMLSEDNGLGNFIEAKLFMGKRKSSKSKVKVPLSRADSEELIAEQWGQLKSAFIDPSNALIFHLTNHYALIFAVREWWIDGDETPVRQILTARRGQRPTAWLDFSEAREIMLGWEGYKIMTVSSRVSRERLWAEKV